MDCVMMSMMSMMCRGLNHESGKPVNRPDDDEEYPRTQIQCYFKEKTVMLSSLH